MLRKLVIAVEIIGAATAVIAFYEIFLAKKHVASVSAVLDLCQVDSRGQFELGLANSIEENADRFLYLNLVFLNLGLPEQGQCESDPMDVIEFNMSDEANSTLYLPPSHFPQILEAQTAWVNNSLHFDLPRIKRSVLANAYEDPFEGSFTMEGLFYADFDSVGEAGSNFEMIPAPFDATTEAMSRCTKSLLSMNPIEYVWTYATVCVLN
ncbi:MAG: hypothetical protein ABJM43_07570 [Paracoccaceae bacterium]|uniref:hypothetical protein n=1 Tax=Ascidiaceihabitans sp. TaxID=1872644 RepID=UPI003297E72A